MDTTELQNQAIEIRDAENEGENTALRVGTMLLAIIDAFANIVDLDTLQQILEQYASTTGNGQIHWRHARCVFLASMGADFDAVNGDGWEYTNHNGDIVFNPTSKNLRVVGETGTYFVAANVLYVHAHTCHTYKWDAAEQKMVEITDTNLPTVITYKNTPAFSQVAIGESYVFQSQSSGPKIAIKISSSETYSFLPDSKKIYAFRDIRQAMLWKPSNQTWVSLTPRVINDLITGGEGDALSAEMGKKLNLRLSEVEDGKVDTEEDGFFVVDENGNIGMQYDEDGFDVALLSQHFIRLLNNAGIGSSYKSQCVVRFLPFLSAWNNDEKNSLCLCSTKQQLVDNKVPFYDGFLFHKLPTDDKSLWYGTTLDNAVQIGTMSVYPKNYQLAMSPKDGRVIAVIRGNGQQRADLHVWDGTTDTAVAAVSSDGNSRKPLGWLYNCGYDFIKNGNNEYMIFAEYNGDGTNKGGYYVWKGTYPYTSPSDWKTVFHRPYAGKTYGTIAYGTIAHFHMVRRDPWTSILYLAAGDYPTQLIWWYSTDYGETWTELTNNETNGWEQHVARACNMVFTKDYIYWANDHGVNHCLNRVARNAQTGIIDPSTREKLCDLRFGQACNSICYVESPHGLFMYERIDTGDEFSQQYGTPVKMYFWDIDKGKLYEVANVPLLSGQTWGGSRGKCYLNFTSGQQPRPAMGFSDDTRCIFDIAGSDGQNIGTIFYEL